MKLGSQYKARQRMYLRASLIFLVLVCILLAVSVYERYKIERDMAERRAELEQDYYQLNERKVDLEEKVDYLKDDRSVESEIRRSFDVAKEGEKVVVILDETTNEIETNATSTPTAIKSWWQFWR